MIQPNIQQQNQFMNNKTTLFVGDLHPAITEADLHQIFSQHGKITFLRLNCNPITRKSKCKGFITFETLEQATAAKDALNH